MHDAGRHRWRRNACGSGYRYAISGIAGRSTRVAPTHRRRRRRAASGGVWSEDGGACCACVCLLVCVSDSVDQCKHGRTDPESRRASGCERGLEYWQKAHGAARLVFPPSAMMLTGPVGLNTTGFQGSLPWGRTLQKPGAPTVAVSGHLSEDHPMGTFHPMVSCSKVS